MTDSSRMRRRMRLAALLALTTCGVAHADFKALEALQRGGARVSAALVDLSPSRSMQGLNATTRLTPASVSKVVVAAAALDTWPADKTFETRVLATAPIKSGTVDGDLILHGDGDATLAHTDLLLLASQIRGAGIRKVKGRLVVHPAFGPLGCDNADRCEALDRSDTAFNVPLSALGADYGTWCLDVQPTSVGRDAGVLGCGVAQLPVPVVGTIDTVAANAKGDFWVERTTEDGRDVLKVGGKVQVGDVQRVYRAMSDPAMGAGLLLRQMLVETGVEVKGDVEVTHDEVPAGATVVGHTDGVALREQLGRMLRYSNNYIADLLTLDLAAVLTPKPPTQLGEAAKALSDFLVRTSNKAGRSGSTPRLLSGSGLTPENELSAQDLVTLLETQYRDARDFPAFYGGFVVPRQAPFAFLRGGSTAWQDRVALKTGTMNDPHSVCAVAGYLRKKDGGFMAFAILVNGDEKGNRHVPLYKAMEAIRSDLDAVLAKN